MTLLKLVKDIQEAAIAPNCSVLPLLRMCRLAAAQLKNDSWAEWIRHESDGYPDGAQVPDYRRASIIALKGEFPTMLAGTYRDLPIPASWREDMRSRPLQVGIAKIEKHANPQKGEMPAVPLDPFARAFQLDFGLLGKETCTRLYGVYEDGAFLHIVESVRNRILDYSIELEKELPPANAGEGIPDSGAIKANNPETVHNHFYGNIAGNIAIVGGANNAVNVSGVVAGDFESLRQCLSQSGIADEDINRLQSALQAEPQPAKDKVNGWIAGMCQKAQEKIWDIAADKAQKFLIDALMRFGYMSF